MAALRCLMRVPVTVINRPLMISFTKRSCNVGAQLFFASAKFHCSAYAATKVSFRLWNTTKTTTPSAKSLADEILKTRMGAEGVGGKKEGSPNEEESEEEVKKREAAWKAMKYTFIAFGVTFTSLGLWILVDCGSPQRDDEGRLIEDEFSQMPLVQQYFARTWHQLKHYNKLIREPSREKLLPDPFKEPYYQPPYTLVLELTDVLVHPDWTYQTGWRFKKRPGVDFFLSQVGPPLFEVVIYTAEQGFTAYPIVDALDPNGYIAYRLFRDATRYEEGHHKKDLSCLNRDLSKVIMVDWNVNSVKGHHRNAVMMPRWKGNDDDTKLVDLALFLRTIATSEVEDVREVLDFYQQYDDPIEAFKENLQKIQAQQQQKQSEEVPQKTVVPQTSWSPSFLRSRR